jgi:hypothetical protein
VLAARVAAEQQEQQPQQNGGSQEMSVEQMNLMVPGLIETVEV